MPGRLRSPAADVLHKEFGFGTSVNHLRAKAMSEKKPVKHGEIKITPQPPKRAPGIPRTLQGRLITIRSDYDPERDNREYGCWKMRCLKGTTVWGKCVEPGDEFEISGNHAVILALQ